MKKIYSVYVTETLQRECEIEAESEDEALEILEGKYIEGELVLDYSDLVDTEFSNCRYSKTELNILHEISEFCRNECSECTNCCEDDCILFRIERILGNHE